MKIPTVDLVQNGSFVGLKPLFPNVTYQHDPNIFASSTQIGVISDAPEPRSAAGAVVVNGELIVNSGYKGQGDIGNIRNNTWIYNFTKQRWRELTTTNTPGGRAGAAFVKITDTKLLLHGGWNGSQLDTLAYLDPSTGIWTYPANVSGPSVREQHVGVFYPSLGSQGSYICYGGWNGTLLNDTWSYDIATEIWTQRTTSGTVSPKLDASGVIIGGKIYTIGGATYGTVAIDENKILDIATWTWSDMNPTGRPSPRFGVMGKAIGTNIFIFGGMDVVNDESPLNDLFKYDTTNNTWTNITAGSTLPPARSFSAAGVHGTSIALFGGCPAGGFNSLANDDTWSADFSVSPIVFIQQAGSSTTINSSTVTRGGLQITTSIVGGKAILFFKPTATMPINDLHVFSSITVITA